MTSQEPFPNKQSFKKLFFGGIIIALGFVSYIFILSLNLLNWAVLGTIGLLCLWLLLFIIHPQTNFAIFFALTFVIYIPVSLFRSILPLLLLDIIVVILIFQTLGLRRKEGVRLLGGSVWVFISLVFYLITIILGFLPNQIYSVSTAIQGARTSLFGVSFLLLSSIWMSNIKAVKKFLSIYLIAGSFAVIYGLRQLVFGMLPFELERFQTAGSTLTELEVLGIARIPSTFGIPTPFAFVMMCAFLMAPLVCQIFKCPRPIRKSEWVLMGLFLTGLLISLMRGPLIALGVAILFLYLIRPGSLLIKLIHIFLVSTLFLGLVYNSLRFGFHYSSNPAIRTIGNISESIWSSIPFADESLLSEAQRRRAGYSITGRINSFQENLDLLRKYPMGLGVGGVTTGLTKDIKFGYVEVGFMRVAMETGWVGLFAFLMLLSSVPIIGWIKLIRSKSKFVGALGRQLLAIWVAMFVTMVSGNYLETEILSASIWTIGGILLNLDLIDKSLIEEKQLS